MQRLADLGAERGRAIDPREAGVLLLTSVTDDRAQASTILDLVAAGFKLPADSVRDRCLVGPLEECAERLASFVAAGCTKFVLFPLATPDALIPQIELYGRHLIPRFERSERAADALRA